MAEELRKGGGIDRSTRLVADRPVPSTRKGIKPTNRFNHSGYVATYIHMHKVNISGFVNLTNGASVDA